MPEKMDRCVSDVKGQGKSEDSAWAICTDAMKEADAELKAHPYEETVAIPSGSLSKQNVGAKPHKESECGCPYENKLKEDIIQAKVKEGRPSRNIPNRANYNPDAPINKILNGQVDSKKPFRPKGK